MRIILHKKELVRLFDAISHTGKTSKDVALSQNVSVRALNDWRRGAYTMPLEIYDDMISISHLDKKIFSPRFVPDFWYTKRAGRKGGLARDARYGNFGTLEGRRLGGLHSLVTHAKKKTGFKILQTVGKPKYSKGLAELLGILFGDGHISDYQASITTSSVTDWRHAHFVKNLFERLFSVRVTLSKRKNENALTLVISSRELVRILKEFGMPYGNKIRAGLSVPNWIRQNPKYQQAFLRGLFDTDGCVYLDTHKINGKTYRNIGWTITSYADTLVTDILEILRGLGFSPTHTRRQRSVFMRKHADITSYFSKVGTNNPKHFSRYKKFGRVPKRS